MSKSYTYALPFLQSKGFSVEQIKEKTSERIFDDLVLKGGRSNVVETPFGRINVSIVFCKDGPFDCVQSFIYERDGYTNVDDILSYAAENVLFDKQFQISNKEDVNKIQSGDTLELTFGNFVIGETAGVNSDGKITQTIYIVLPSKHKLIKGEQL